MSEAESEEFMKKSESEEFMKKFDGLCIDGVNKRSVCMSCYLTVLQAQAGFMAEFTKVHSAFCQAYLAAILGCDTEDMLEPIASELEAMVKIFCKRAQLKVKFAHETAKAPSPAAAVAAPVATEDAPSTAAAAAASRTTSV